MRHYVAKLFPISLTALLITASAFGAQQCVEDPHRQTPCSNLAYKMLAADHTSGERAGIVCICLEDFQHLKKQPENPATRILWQRELRMISSRYQITTQQLIELLK